MALGPADSPAEPCLSDETVVALRAGALPDTVQDDVAAHLTRCAACRARLAQGGTTTSAPILTEVSRVSTPPIALELSPGTMVDHYRVEHAVGKGGMGQVYLARDTALGRSVALKIVKPQLAVRPKLREQFFREARAMAKVSHPNIVTIHGVGESEGQPYVALEFVDGETLRSRMSRATLGLEEMARIGAEVADALAAAHAAGVVHRDLKPTNIMLGRDGRTRVVDFGIAKTVEVEPLGVPGDAWPGMTSGGEPTLTVVGGTPMYMPPEQWLGASTGPPADLWALGVVLHELTTGRRPYDAPEFPSHGGTAAPPGLIDRVCDDTPVPLDDRFLPLALAPIVRACLAKDPDTRPSALQVATALWEVADAPPRSRASARGLRELDAPPSVAKTPRSPFPAGRPFRRRSRTVLLAGAIVSMGLGGATAFAISGPSPRVATPRWTQLHSWTPPPVVERRASGADTPRGASPSVGSEHAGADAPPPALPSAGADAAGRLPSPRAGGERSTSNRAASRDPLSYR
ncbi:MAG: protein kinase [Myxococcota bacterium]